jgi:hypothetical protein
MSHLQTSLVNAIYYNQNSKARFAKLTDVSNTGFVNYNAIVGRNEGCEDGGARQRVPPLRHCEK